MNSFMRSKAQSQEAIIAFQSDKAQKDFIYQTSTTIEKLNHGLVGVALSIEKLKAKAESDRKLLEIHFENLEQKVLKESDTTVNTLGDYASSMLHLTESIDKKFTSIDQGMTDLKNAVSTFSVVHTKLADLEKKLEVERAYLDSALVLMKRETLDQIASVRKDLTPAPPKSDPIQDALDERLNPLQIDFKGLVKEIEILKKAVKYGEKKFENIYTLIERLKNVTSR